MDVKELRECIDDLLVYLEDHKFDIADTLQEYNVSYYDLRCTLLRCVPTPDLDLVSFKNTPLWFTLHRAVSILIDILEKNKKVA